MSFRFTKFFPWASSNLFDRQEQLSKFGLDGCAYPTEDKVSSFTLGLVAIICTTYIVFPVKILSGIQSFCVAVTRSECVLVFQPLFFSDIHGIGAILHIF